MSSPCRVTGWDIGGVGAKCVHIDETGTPVGKRSAPLEVWKSPGEMEALLRELAADNAAGGVAMAITMTAELCDCFETKRDGVLHILESFHRAFPENPSWLLSNRGNWVALDKAFDDPLQFAASNWVAAASHLAKTVGDGLWVDVGSTTTDIIPLTGGAPAPLGGTDTERLVNGELVYTGVVRSNPNMLARRVPVRGRWCRPADERFCSMGDCYVLLGDVDPALVDGFTSDGRSTEERFAMARLARLVCSDREYLAERELRMLAAFLKGRQLALIQDAMFQVCSRLDVSPAVIPTGIGKFLAEETAERMGLNVRSADDCIPPGYDEQFPAFAAASELFAAMGGDGK
ncbi:MAG: hydantoinase/oxoprolinase family protein [Synergistota bacterium]|nr:hydantoinase/oxoprolinase family protein [Synergistota bacterium]